MKIAVFGINYHPELIGIGLYTTELCEYLSQKNHEIDVFTAFPYYPFGYNFKSWHTTNRLLKYSLFLKEEIQGVTVFRVNFFKPKKPNALKRILHEATFVFMITARCLFCRKKYDLAICISPPLALGLTAWVFARIRRIPLLLHIQDLVPDAIIDLRILKEGFIVSCLRILEKFLYQKADIVSTISEGMRERIIQKGLPTKKVALLPNWSNTSKIKPVPKDNSFRKEYGLSQKFILLHAGNMGEKQDFSIIIECAKKLAHDKDIVFLLAGRGIKRPFVEKSITIEHLSNIVLIDVQPEDKLSEMFSASDAALIAQMKGIKNVVMPSKFFGPAAAKKPFIIAAEKECEIAKEAILYDFGLCIEPGEPEQLIKAIYRLKNDSHLTKRLGENSYKFVSRYRGKQDMLKNFEEVLCAIKNNEPSSISCTRH